MVFCNVKEFVYFLLDWGDFVVFGVLVVDYVNVDLFICQDVGIDNDGFVVFVFIIDG